MRRLVNIFQLLFRKQRLEDELEAELQSYFAMLVDRYVEQGMPLDQARREARIEVEGIEQVKEKTRDARTGTLLESILQDIRYAGRTLRKSLSFSVVAILTLALGIGVNTAIFSVVYAVLLKSLPFDRPEQLTLIWSDFEKTAAFRAPTSGPIFDNIQRRSRLLEDVAATWSTVGVFTGEGDAEQIRVARVTANFFTVMGVHPALGRGFVAEENPGGRLAMILSDALWRRRFGADRNIAGKSVRFQGGNFTIVGVLPETFRNLAPGIPADVEAFTSFPDNIYKAPRTQYYLRLIARMKPGVTISQAQQEMADLAVQIRGAYPEYQAENLKLNIASMHADAVRDIRPALIALFAGAGFVMLICCVNVANLLLARASDRSKEIAVRAAIGASRSRILRQLLTEGVLLCAAAGVVGIAGGWAALRLLIRIQPDAVSGMSEIGLNWPVLAFSAAVSLGSVLLFALAPSIESAKWDLITTLRESGRTSRAPMRRGLRAALIVAEISAGFILVIGAGLMIRTLEKIQRVRPGFDSDRVLTFAMNVPYGRFKSEEAVYGFMREWEAQIAALPGVESVGAVSHLPLDISVNWYSPFRPEGVSKTEGAAFLADHRAVTAGFLPAMRTRLLDGRFFNDRDRAGGREVVIVDDLLASTTWPGQSAVGKKIESEHFTNRGIIPVWAEVVGVVEHVRGHSLSKVVRPEIYIPFEQSPRSPMNYAVRTRGDAAALAGPIRELLRQRDRNIAIAKVRLMSNYVDRAKAPATLTATLAGIFGALALILAAIGIYGVIYYSVSRRMHEMGVRKALGASGRDVMRLILKEGLGLTAVGMILGVAGAIAASRELTGLIYGIQTVDPVTYMGAILMIAFAALAGCWLPASKAADANPIDAIRVE
jgi:putative ABC transport system permease protein